LATSRARRARPETATFLQQGGDGHRAALSFAVSDGRITRIDAIRNPEKLRHL